jgi:hypothetical protein|tara:strand:- start:3016 stop:3348 length:333 start_codon:yes stop_codon:yes gene_type:complete
LPRSLSGFYAKATGQDASSTGLGALRTFRLLRVFKLARSWKDLQKLLLMIMQSVMDVTNAVALLGIIMFIFTLLGMQLFGGKMKWYYYGTFVNYTKTIFCCVDPWYKCNH